MELSRQGTVRADPAIVWAFAVDVERWPDVMGHITRVERHDDAPFGMASAATLVQPGLPSTVWTVDEFIEGERFRWSGNPLGMRWSADHVVEPTSDGDTRLTLSVTAAGRMAKLLGPMVRAAAARALRLEIDGFRTACE